jgi:hypothetical protein
MILTQQWSGLVVPDKLEINHCRIDRNTRHLRR